MKAKAAGQETQRPAPLSMIACVIAVITGTVSTGCRWQAYRRSELPADQANHAPPRGVDLATPTLVNAATDTRVTCPPGWEPTTTRDFVVMLLPTKMPARSRSDSTNLRWGENFISLDVPKLPTFRPPGFLPMHRVRGGYIDDLCRHTLDANVEDFKSPPIPDAKAALVRATWPGDRPTHVETALILTHADRVYILRGRSRIEDEPATRAAFDQVVQSLRWTR